MAVLGQVAPFIFYPYTRFFDLKILTFWQITINRGEKAGNYLIYI